MIQRKRGRERERESPTVSVSKLLSSEDKGMHDAYVAVLSTGQVVVYSKVTELARFTADTPGQVTTTH